MKFFKNIFQSKKSKARLGEIKTDHGLIKTPAFVPVATKGTLKALPPCFIKDLGMQTAFVNTYHLVIHPGVETIQKAGGIHKFANLNIPLMSDSGGFQIFSLAREKNQKLNIKYQKYLSTSSRSRVQSRDKSNIKNGNTKKADIRGEEQPLLVEILESGVKFRSTYDGKLVEFTPEKSMQFQHKIGTDIIMAFDECIYYGSGYQYAKKATERTHRWLERCISEIRRWRVDDGRWRKENRGLKIESKKSTVYPQSLKTHPRFSIVDRQYLYGIIQGGIYEDLRKQSAKFVVSQPIDGVAIGGVSVGETKKEMREQVDWVSDYLPKDKPVHLLGVGQFDDIIDLVKLGIDTFDCVEPTRLARMGKVYQWERIFSRLSLPPVLTTSSRLEKSLRAVGSPSGRVTSSRLDFDIDIFKGIYKNNLSPVDKNCNCYTCTNFTKAYLHHLFKQKEILGYTLATYHNLWVMKRFFDNIRMLIADNQI